MLSLILYGALALVVAAVVVSILVVVLPDDTVAVAARDRIPAGLPASGQLGAQDVNRLRLPVGLRGYRMADTDAVLDRLSIEIERRDQEIAQLRSGDPAPEDIAATELDATDSPVPVVALGESPEEAQAQPVFSDVAPSEPTTGPAPTLHVATPQTGGHS